MRVGESPLLFHVAHLVETGELDGVLDGRLGHLGKSQEGEQLLQGCARLAVDLLVFEQQEVVGHVPVVGPYVVEADEMVHAAHAAVQEVGDLALEFGHFPVGVEPLGAPGLVEVVRDGYVAQVADEQDHALAGVAGFVALDLFHRSAGRLAVVGEGYPRDFPQLFHAFRVEQSGAVRFQVVDSGVLVQSPAEHDPQPGPAALGEGDQVRVGAAADGQDVADFAQQMEHGNSFRGWVKRVIFTIDRLMVSQLSLSRLD